MRKRREIEEEDDWEAPGRRAGSAPPRAPPRSRPSSGPSFRAHTDSSRKKSTFAPAPEQTPEPAPAPAAGHHRASSAAAAAPKERGSEKDGAVKKFLDAFASGQSLRSEGFARPEIEGLAERIGEGRPVRSPAVAGDSVPYLMFERLARQHIRDQISNEEKMAELVAKHAAKASALEKDLAETREELQGTRRAFLASQAATAKLKGESETAAEELRELKQEAQRHTSDHSALITQKEISDALLAGARSEIASLTRKILSLEASLEIVKDQKHEAEQALARSDEVAREKLRQVVAKGDDAEQKLSAAQGQVESLSRQNAELQAQLAASMAQLALLSERLSHRTRELQRFGKQAKTGQTVAAPAGRVAIAFSDVEASSAQWEANPDAMKLALDLHFKVLREKLADTSGYEVKVEGDAMMAAFSSATDAVRWALTVQESLLVADWSGLIMSSKFSNEVRNPRGVLLFRGLRVRIGVHVGPVSSTLDRVTHRMDYYGSSVNRAARITSLAHGGQVLVSDATWQEIKPDATRFVATRIGEFKLKGLEDPEEITQVLPFSLKERVFPALRTFIMEDGGNELLKTKSKPAACPSSPRSPSEPGSDSPTSETRDFDTLLKFLLEMNARLLPIEQARCAVIIDDTARLKKKAMEHAEMTSILQEKRDGLQKALTESRSEIDRLKKSLLELTGSLPGPQTPHGTPAPPTIPDASPLNQRIKELESELAMTQNALKEARENLAQERSEKKALAQMVQSTTKPPSSSAGSGSRPGSGITKNPREALDDLSDSSKTSALVDLQMQLLVLRGKNGDLENELKKEREARVTLQKHLSQIHDVLPDSQGVSLTLVAESRYSATEPTPQLPPSIFVTPSGVDEDGRTPRPVPLTFEPKDPGVVLLQRRVASLEEELGNVTQEKRETVSKLESYTASLRDSIRSLEASLVGLRVERDQLKEQLKASSIQTSGTTPAGEFGLASHNVALTRHLQEAQDTIMEQAARIAQLQDKLEALERTPTSSRDPPTSARSVARVATKEMRFETPPVSARRQSQPVPSQVVGKKSGKPHK